MGTRRAKEIARKSLAVVWSRFTKHGTRFCVGVENCYDDTTTTAVLE
jgi:hypothetical protein